MTVAAQEQRPAKFLMSFRGATLLLRSVVDLLLPNGQPTFLYVLTGEGFLVVGFAAIITLGNLFGLQGVAYGALVGQLVLATSLYLFAKMVSGISWNAPPVIIFIGVFLVGGFALNVTLGSSHIAFSILHAGAVLVVCPLVGILLLFTPSERRSALAAISRVRR